MNFRIVSDSVIQVNCMGGGKLYDWTPPINVYEALKFVTNSKVSSYIMNFDTIPHLVMYVNEECNYKQPIKETVIINHWISDLHLLK